MLREFYAFLFVFCDLPERNENRVFCPFVCVCGMNDKVKEKKSLQLGVDISDTDTFNSVYR